MLGSHHFGKLPWMFEGSVLGIEGCGFGFSTLLRVFGFGSRGFPFVGLLGGLVFRSLFAGNWLGVVQNNL